MSGDVLTCVVLLLCSYLFNLKALYTTQYAATGVTVSTVNSSITPDCQQWPWEHQNVDCPIPHLCTHACTHTHTRKAAENMIMTEQFSNFHNLLKSHQNSSMLSVITIKYGTDNIMLASSTLSFWFHYLCMHQNELFSQSVLRWDMRLSYL